MISHQLHLAQEDIEERVTEIDGHPSFHTITYNHLLSKLQFTRVFQWICVNAAP